MTFGSYIAAALHRRLLMASFMRDGDISMSNTAPPKSPALSGAFIVWSRGQGLYMHNVDAASQRGAVSNLARLVRAFFRLLIVRGQPLQQAYRSPHKAQVPIVFLLIF